MPPAFTEITYELHLAADLSIGSGVGLPGVIDEYVVRDAEDFAFAPFSGIKGMARDSCVHLMKFLRCYETNDYACAGQRALIDANELGQASPRGLCGLQIAQKLCVLCANFGSPITPARWLFSAAQYAESYRETVRGFESKDRNAGSTRGSLARRDSETSAHAAIDPWTKRAAENQLFNLEVVRLPDTNEALRQLATWTGTIVYHAPLQGAKETARSDDELVGWLLAALLFTRRIGGQRRRGWGRCRFVLVGDDKIALEAKLNTWFEQLERDAILSAGG